MKPIVLLQYFKVNVTTFQYRLALKGKAYLQVHSSQKMKIGTGLYWKKYNIVEKRIRVFKKCLKL